MDRLGSGLNHSTLHDTASTPPVKHLDRLLSGLLSILREVNKKFSRSTLRRNGHPQQSTQAGYMTYAACVRRKASNVLSFSFGVFREF
jgi:hypothetical protein